MKVKTVRKHSERFSIKSKSQYSSLDSSIRPLLLSDLVKRGLVFELLLLIEVRKFDVSQLSNNGGEGRHQQFRQLAGSCLDVDSR